MKRLDWMPRNLSKENCLTTLLYFVLTLGLFGGSAFAETSQSTPPIQDKVTQGALRVKIDEKVIECPLKHTDVKANITGFIARVTVTQTFYNPYDEKIEAVYVFPLSHTAAVDALTMHIGERKIVGLMKRRAEAQAIYQRALQHGQTTGLLEQERPNIFTQSVGNIKPQQEIQIEISYVDVLKYDVGTYEFHFPMVVTPRYIPGVPISEKPQLPKELEGKVGEVKEHVTAVTLGPEPSGTGWAPDTTRVPDASRITPPVLKPGYRTGHDISLSVSLDAGVPIQDIKIVNHAAILEQLGTSVARVEISPTDSIPNKDFVMAYAVAGEKPEVAVFAHAAGPEQRYFMLMIQPKLDAELSKAPPRELVFLIDASGSMSGEPIAKVKAAMRHFFALSKPNDTFQVITFANHTTKLFENPVRATEANVAKALTFTQEMKGSGGTEMLAGIKTVLNAPVDSERVRIVVLLTDGAIGNESEIIAEVGRRAGDQIRFWVIGIGAAPNRFLIDGVARQGGGMSGVLDFNSNPKPLVTQVVERIHRTQLAHIQVDWNNLLIYETYPRRIPELWVGSPVIVFGRYAAGGSTEIALNGTAEGKSITYKLDITLPDAEPAHEVLAKVWARRKIEDLSAQIHTADTPEVIEEITRIALDYRLMSQYTSFVAVDESEMSSASQQAQRPRRVVVPVPLPAGVNFTGIFGKNEEEPQFFYDLFGKELLEGNEVYNYRESLEEKTFDQNGELIVGWTGQFDNRRIQKQFPNFFQAPGKTAAPRHGRRNGLNAESGRYRGRYTEFAIGDAKNFQHTAPQYTILREAAKAAIADAQALQKQEQLEAARLRYQHALGLMVGLYNHDDSTGATALAAIRTLSDEIEKKRAQAHPELNQKLNLVLRNQGLADAIRTLVNTAGFQLDLVPGSLSDVDALLKSRAHRVTYLDLRQATVIQGLERLIAPYHLTWEVKVPDTITVGTARRMQGNSVWGYDVLDLAMPLVNELDEDNPQESVENALTDFLKAVKIVINQEKEGIQPATATLLDAKRLLVYGDAEVHQKVHRFLEALQNGESDVTRSADRRLSKDEAAALKALQKLTVNRWKTVAKARETRAAAKAHQRITTELKTASWLLLAEALNGKVHMEALTRLQMVWQAPEIISVIEDRYLLPVVMCSAWCIRTAAQVVPTDPELAALSDNVLSKVRQIRTLKPQDDSSTAYLGTLYALLALEDGDRPDARRSLIRERTNTDIDIARLIAQSLLSPSEKSDKALQAIFSPYQISDGNLILLTCLAAKRRGGQLWQTFREELPHIIRQSQLNGQMIIIVNRLAASPLIQ